MKRISILLAVVAMMISCTQPSTSYTISGTIDNPEFDNTYAYISEASGRNLVTLDSALIENGKFAFEGDAENVNIYYISLDRTIDRNMLSQIVIEPGKITANATSEGFIIGGTPLNNTLGKFNADIKEKQKAQMDISLAFKKANEEGTITEELSDEFMAKYDVITDEIKVLVFDHIKSNITNDLGKFQFLANVGSFDLEEQETLVALVDEEFKAKEEVQAIITRIENAKNVAIGKKFVDFTSKDTEGNDVSLSDYAGKGKVVLIDFWAAWCGPCIHEMPNVVATYKKYKEKGFEVVGVSFDNDKDAWLNAIKNLGMDWPQMSDLNSWDNPAVSLYGIQGIPHTVLLDGEGIIVDKDLRGENLEKRVSELLD